VNDEQGWLWIVEETTVVDFRRWNRPLVRRGCRWEDNIKMHSREVRIECGLDLSGSV
jgi:hypothetical protein